MWPLGASAVEETAATISIDVPADYKWVLLAFAGVFFTNMYLVVNVIMARKKYDVKYPNLYAPAGHKHAEAFNSAQRAHQQTLEGLPYFLMQLLVVGLYYPLFAAACGGLWNVGKIVYGYGYAKNGPTGRHVGGLIGHLGDMPLQVALFKIIYDLFQ